jgi:hypothetical protein
LSLQPRRATKGASQPPKGLVSRSANVRGSHSLPGPTPRCGRWQIRRVCVRRAGGSRRSLIMPPPPPHPARSREVQQAWRGGCALCGACLGPGRLQSHEWCSAVRRGLRRSSSSSPAAGRASYRQAAGRRWCAGRRGQRPKRAPPAATAVAAAAAAGGCGGRRHPHNGSHRPSAGFWWISQTPVLTPAPCQSEPYDGEHTRKQHAKGHSCGVWSGHHTPFRSKLSPTTWRWRSCMALRPFARGNRCWTVKKLF